MTTPTGSWPADELAAFGSADEIRLGVRRADGTLRRPVTIWIVRALGDPVDAAYRAKYGRYPVTYVDAIVTPRAREATLRLLPR